MGIYTPLDGTSVPESDANSHADAVPEPDANSHADAVPESDANSHADAVPEPWDRSGDGDRGCRDGVFTPEQLAQGAAAADNGRAAGLRTRPGAGQVPAHGAGAER